MSEENPTTKKLDVRRITLIIILINSIILIPLVSVILANVGGTAVFITTIVFFGILIATSFVAIIYDLTILLKNRKARKEDTKKDE
ncbi:MAG: hypothetical protein ACTSXA_13755 [Candidatus Heimdallarchaeota archaeon]